MSCYVRNATTKCIPTVTKRSRKLLPDSHQNEIEGQLKGLWDRINEAFEWANPAVIARELGLERHSIYKWKNGKSQPTIENLLKISTVTNSSLDWLLTGRGQRYLSEKISGYADIEQKIIKVVQPLLDDLERKIAAAKKAK